MVKLKHTLINNRIMLENIDDLPYGEDDYLDVLIWTRSKREVEDAINHCEKNGLSQYLTKSKDKNTIIAPVNIIKYEILQRVKNGEDFNCSLLIDKLKSSVQRRSGDEFKYIPDQYIELLKQNGFGKEKAYISWGDKRKFLLPLIIDCRIEEIYNELVSLGESLKNELGLNGYETITYTPYGEQHNSLKPFSVVILCLPGKLRETIHIGIRIRKDKYCPTLHVGDKLMKKIDKDNFDFPIEEKGDFLMGHFSDLEDSISYMKYKLLPLLKLYNSNIINKVGRKIDISKEIYTYKSSSKADTEHLHNFVTKEYKAYSGAISLKSLYLIKISGVSFGNDFNLYKVGVSDNPIKRFKQIAMGFGMSDRIRITKLLVANLSGDKEKQVKASLISCDGIEYCNEFFISSKSDEEVVKMVETFLCLN